ncbi:MAG: HD domain-containing protein, partial [Bacteroidales bacterium]|nr:HD domain-containing protein [Bacteroidales bacterium]
HYTEGDLQEMKMPEEVEHLSHVLTSDDNTFFIDESKNDLLLGGPEESMIDFRHTLEFLKGFEFTCAEMLSTGHIAFGTRGGGVFIGTEDGRFLSRISTSDGLYGDNIIQLLVDASDNLWALHEHAVSRIETPSAFSFFDRDNGLDGNVQDLIRHEGILYAASSQGLFRLQSKEGHSLAMAENPIFIRLPGIEGDCRCLAGAPGKLLVGSGAGLYEVTGKQPSLVLSDPVNALCYESGQNLLLVGTDRGFRIFDVNGWTESKNLSLPSVSIDDIAISPAGFLWLSSRSGMLYRSTTPFSNVGNLSYLSYTADDLTSGRDMYIDLIRLPGELYFSGFEGLFSYDPATGQFQPDTVFSFPYSQGSYRIGQMVEDCVGKLWISIDHPEEDGNKIWQARSTEGVEYPEGANFVLHPMRYRRLNKKIINCMLAEPENTMWIGTHDGLLRFEPEFSRPLAPVSRTHISGVIIGDDPVMQYDYPASRVRIPYSKNSIRFDFISTDYTCESSPYFQHRLSGLNAQWSEWSDHSFIEFSGLRRGTYEFLVRSQDIFGIVSEPVLFRFAIKSPFYASGYAILFYFVVALVLFYMTQKWRNLQLIKQQYHLEEVVLERTELLIKEKEKSDNILDNILPKTTSDELKLTGKVTSSKFKMCTVLFADIQGFTKIAEEMDADKLIDQLDRFYFQFDSVVEKYNIEKIKTIGDAYMAAGGIPIKNRTNPVEVVLAALEMQLYMKELRKTKTDIWDLRIGIHTGSVIAGVVGQKKYSYDIWGDSVNTASRMESSGEAGRVNISATTYKLIKDFFQCEFRGKMPVKYKGDIAMFFVNGLNPVFSEADKVTPNAKFIIQIQLLRLLDVEEFIIERLEKELPEDLFFHNVEHTVHVYSQVELLGRGEKVSEEDLLLLRTAALLHDMGYIDRMDDHETRSVEYAREILPLYRYNEDQIEKICNLIMATTIPPKPQNLLEQIICDANLDHLGRVDFLIQSDKLFQEYRMRHKIKSKKDWNHYQINLLENHDFYTDIANKMREVPKEQQIENIRQFS